METPPGEPEAWHRTGWYRQSGGGFREIVRVLRPGGRAVVHLTDTAKAPLESIHGSGTTDAWGLWYWSDTDVRRMAEKAGLVDVTVSLLPVISKPQLVRGMKPPPHRA